MFSVSFWNNWPKVYKGLFQILLLLFLSSVAFATVSFIWNPSPVFTWQQIQELKQLELPIHSFDVGGFDITVHTFNYILYERWLGNTLAIHMPPLDFYLAIFCMALVVLMALVTVLPRFWFYIAGGMIVVMVSSFQLETLEIFGLDNRIPAIVTITLLLGLSVYFQFFNRATSFVKRLLCFAGVITVTGLVIYQFSDAVRPLRSLAINTFPFSIVLMLIFIIIVAHEIVASFVSLVGSGSRNEKSLRHLLVISAIYFINLWLAYLTRIGSLEWGFVVPPFLLLIVSSVLAIWGIYQRRTLYEDIFAAEYFSVFMVLALGAASFGCAGYFFATADDVSIISLNDLILFAHIGYGMMFLVYVASNFLGMIAANLPVQRILYKPTNMPYFSYRLAGLIFTLAFVFYNRWMVPVNHFVSGYYTATGDLYASEEDTTRASLYYKRAHFYASYNQHAATALADQERMKGNAFKELEYLADANAFKPSEFTLLNEANVFNLYGNPLNEIQVLQTGRRALPKSGLVNNNLGLAYASVGQVDSAYRYLTLAAQTKNSLASAEMNLLGLIVEWNLVLDGDSLREKFNSGHYGKKANELALANQREKKIEINYSFPKDSLLNVFSATQLANYLTNHISVTDTSLLAAAIKVARKDENREYHEIILVPAAMACYSSGQLNRAFSLLQEVIFRGRNQGKHNTTMALWALDLGKPEVALDYWRYAINQPQAGIANAVTLAEAGKIDEAIVAWDTLGKRGDTTVRAMAESMKRVLAAPESWFADLSDKEKYQYLRHRIPLESNAFDRLIGTVKNEDLRAKAILDRSRKWFDQDEIVLAANTYAKLQGLHLTDMRLFADIKYFELELIARQENWTGLEEQIKKGILFGPYRETERVYYEALLQLNAGNTDSASMNLDWIAENNSYFDDGIVRAASFFQTHGSDKSKPYRILSEALQVNPSSVKILKAYIPEALRNGLDEYAVSALHTLGGLLPKPAYSKYVSEKQLEGLLRQ